MTSDFKYAGIISGAGAIMDLNLITKDNNIPTMLFHGNADPLVPYGTAVHYFCLPNSSGWLMLFGSHSIAKHLENLEGTCQLTTFEGGKHSFAGAYFYQKQEKVSKFIHHVLDGKKFAEYITVLPEN